MLINDSYLNLFKEGKMAGEQGIAFQSVVAEEGVVSEDLVFLHRCEWKVGSKTITVETDGRDLDAAKIKLVKELGFKTHSNTDASLLNLFSTLQKIYDIKLIDYALV